MSVLFEEYASSIISSLGEPPEPQRRESNQRGIGDILDQLTGQLTRRFKGDDRNLDSFWEGSGRALASDEDIASGEFGIGEYGLEILAFYKSLHFRPQRPFPGHWGIFITGYGIRSIADGLEVFYPRRFTDWQRLDLAFEFLHRHERFHFRFDAWVISHEATLRSHLYDNYHNRIYGTLHPSVDCVEESLANRHAFDSMRRDDICAFLRDYISGMPAAYANIFAMDRESTLAQLGAQVLLGEPGWRTRLPGSGLEQVPYIGRGESPLLGDSSCPVYLVTQTNISRLSSAFPGIPPLGEWRTFVEKYLDGKPADATDHQKRRIDNGEVLKMPNPHGNDRLKPWELKGSLQKAGMHMKDFRRERERTSVWTRHVPRQPPLPPIGV